ncbi:MAG TPA: hypothetical protein VN965_09065 [Candidatus Dormibacteraeota bacterium]|nr:hypothetical protein [Candidatus Dormibacteraeota bacterium]
MRILEIAGEAAVAQDGGDQLGQVRYRFVGSQGKSRGLTGWRLKSDPANSILRSTPTVAKMRLVTELKNVSASPQSGRCAMTHE